MVTEEDYTNFIRKQAERSKQITKSIKEKQMKKLHTLKENQFKLHGFIFNESWFENITNLEIPIEIKWMLSLGRKFALPIDKHGFSPLHVIADIEQCIQAIDDNKNQIKEVARTKLANNIIGYKRKLNNTPKEKFLLTVFKKTKNFLNKHDDVITLQADKGNKTVLMYKKDYKDKMEKLLEDKNTYRTNRTDPTQKLQRENNSIVSDLFKNECIDSWQKRRLFCSAAIAPRIYGLPKIHKINTPLRPIVSSMSVPCYQLSKYIGQLLKHIVSEKYNIKNSAELKKQLQHISIAENEVLISFDVVSLFTNIPVHTAIKNIMAKWDTIKKQTKISRSIFLKILKFCLTDNNYFVYDKKIYSQIFGMPMGNPLSPTIADIVLDSLLDEAIIELKKKDINLKYIVKYVDDILAIIKHDDKDEILNAFNTYHSKIQFTTEIEKSNKIAYLDTYLHRHNNKIKFDWYSKETSSGRLMNFNSTQPKYQIINTARNFIYRVLYISDEEFHIKNIKQIKWTLINNSFPIKLINTLITETQRKLKNNVTTKNKENNDKVFYSVKYIPGLTDNKNIKMAMKTENICFAYKPHTTLNSIFTKIKAPVEKQQQNNVVYEIPCKGNDEENCDLIYIGTTKRNLQTRICEHENDIDKHKETTALSKHMINEKHKPDFDKIRILDIETKEKKRYTIESLRIQQKINSTMNLKEDTDNISFSYLAVIK